MSRPMLLVFLLLIIVITSQFELKQQLATDSDSSLPISPKQKYVSNRGEVIKEKIILTQEKNIEKLNDVVRSLREQLRQCIAVNGNETAYSNLGSLATENVIELRRQQIMED